MRAGVSASPLWRGMPNLVGKSLRMRAMMCMGMGCDMGLAPLLWDCVQYSMPAAPAQSGGGRSAQSFTDC
ncbi:hypothetical protein AGATL06_07040 [Agathobaculum sp. TL06]